MASHAVEQARLRYPDLVDPGCAHVRFAGALVVQAGHGNKGRNWLDLAWHVAALHSRQPGFKEGLARLAGAVGGMGRHTESRGAGVMMGLLYKHDPWQHSSGSSAGPAAAVPPMVEVFVGEAAAAAMGGWWGVPGA